jgi:hypothetical protein
MVPTKFDRRNNAIKFMLYFLAIAPFVLPYLFPKSNAQLQSRWTAVGILVGIGSAFGVSLELYRNRGRHWTAFALLLINGLLIGMMIIGGLVELLR